MFSFWKRPKIATHTIVARDPYAFGHRLGEGTREQVTVLMDLVESSLEFQSLRREGLIDQNLSFLHTAYPELFWELRGLAEGAGASLEAVAALNFFEDFILKVTERCSLLASRHHQGILMGWNEDAQKLYDGRMSLITGYLNGQGFVSLNYPGLLCGDTLAINAHGLVLAMQSLKPVLKEGAAAVGLPWGLAGRLFLFVRNIGEVLKLAKHISRAGSLLHGFHLFCYDPHEAQAVSIEFHPQYPQPWYMSMEHSFFFAHTNHYQLLEKDSSRQQHITDSSRGRLCYLELYKKTPLSPEFLADILSNRHPKEVFPGEKICREGHISTIHSQVLAMSFGGGPTLWTSPGRPSQHPFKNWDKREISFS